MRMIARAVSGAFVIGGMFCTLGCPSPLPRLSARTVSCHPRDIFITEHLRSDRYQQWTAVCDGHRHRCVQHGDEWPTCTPEVAPTPLQAHVMRENVESEGETFVALRSVMPVDGFVIEVAVAPSRSLDDTWVSISRDGAAPSQCRVGLLADGELFEVSPVERFEAAQRSGFRGRLPMAFLRRMHAATRVSGRLCGREWRLDDAGRAALDELMARLAEERVWVEGRSITPQEAGQTSAESQSTEPQTATPSAADSSADTPPPQ